jgi:putative ABC transport system substrate-binding protein
VDGILNGAKPAGLPVEQPAAKALGLTIPPSPLQRGDQVIE